MNKFMGSQPMLMEIQHASLGKAYKKPSPAEFFKSTYDWLKTIGKLGSSILLFSIISFFGFISGNKLLGILGLFYIISIIVRIPDTYSDAFYFESIATLGLILTFITNIQTAVFFTLTAEWLTKFISPFGPVEDYNETFSECIAVSAALIILTMAIPFKGDLLMYMVYFQIVRFTIFYLGIAITSPATLMNDLFQGTVIVPLSVIQSYIILLFVGAWVFKLYGVTGWTLISIWSFFGK